MEIYKNINRELTLKVQSLQMQLAESRTENIKLNAELMQQRKKMHNLKSVIEETINNNLLGYNRIAAAFTDTSARESGCATPAPRASKRHSNSNAYQSIRQEREASFPRVFTPLQKDSTTDQDYTANHPDDEPSIAHEESTIKHLTGDLDDTHGLTDASIDECDDPIETNSMPILMRSTSTIPMPVRVSAISPEPNQDNENAEAEYQESVANEMCPSTMPLETINEDSESDHNMSNSYLSDATSIANAPSLISSNVSLRRGVSNNQRKKSSFFDDQLSAQNNSAVLYSIDYGVLNADLSNTLLSTPDPSAIRHSLSNTFGLLSSPQSTRRQPSNQGVTDHNDQVATTHLGGKHPIGRALSDLTNINNSMVTPKKSSVDPSTDIGDLTDLTLMGGATCSTPNNHGVSMDTVEEVKVARVRRSIRQSVSEMYKMPTRKSVALEKLQEMSTQSNDCNSSSSTVVSLVTTQSSELTTSSRRSVNIVEASTTDGRPKRKAAPVSFREAALNAKMRNPNSKTKIKRK